MINAFEGGEGTFSSTRVTLARIDHVVAPADMPRRLDQCRVLVRTRIRVQCVRSIQRHGHSPVIAVSQECPRRESTREEAAWSEEAVCRASGQRENNDVSVKTVTSAAKPLLARRPKDEEELVIRSRAQVTKLFKRRKDEREEVNKRRGVNHEHGEPRAKAQGERETDGENPAPLYRFKLGKEKAQKTKNESLASNSTKH